ncbi:hypothetical protein M0Q28_04825 [Patescibacteria group bacterium]|jgi:hypothetical protein|nr:hypothetical protein [Patescibacteria group bacterium]
MPRKMYRNVEDVPQPEERPGSGTPRSAKEAALARMAETKRNVQGQKARMQEEMKRRKEAAEDYPEIVEQVEMEAEEGKALAEEAEQIETAQAIERRSKSKKKEETLSVGEARARFEKIEKDLAEMGVTSFADKMNDPEWVKADAAMRHAERAGRAETGKRKVAEYKKIQELEAEKADNLKRMQEMGGVWGGESYFLLSERNEEIEAELAKLGGRSKEKKAKAVEAPMTEEMMVAGEPTPEDRVADARKTIDFMNGYEQEIVARQRAVQAELKKHGIKDAAQIDAEMEVISPELREKSIGLKPDIWYKMKRLGRNLMGLERPPEVKQLLKKYAELEGEMNEQLHKRREAEAELMAAHAAAGHEVSTGTISTAALRAMERRVRSGGGDGGLDVSSLLNKVIPAGADQLHVEQELESLKHIGEGSLQKELAAVRALRMLEEDIQDAMQNVASKKDEMTLEDAQMYKDRLQELQTRVTNLDNEAGKSKEAAEAAKNTEAALAQYRRMVNTAVADLQRGVRESGKGSRPGSVVGMRAGTKGTYGASTPDRRVVSLSKMETADTKERKESEAAKAAERVNKDVQMYRSIKWRKELIDTINSNEAVRSAMHAVYEAYKKRAQEMMEQGELNLTTGSPDPALDYALNLYRLYARKENGKHQYSEKICQAASEEINHTDELLGAQWDTGRTTDRLVSALLSGLPSVMVEPGYAAEAAAKKEEEEVELQDSDLEEVVEEPIPLKRLKPQRPSLEIPTTEVRERIDREARESFEASLTETTPEQPLPHIKRALSEEEQEAAEEAGIPSVQELAAMGKREEAPASSNEDLINMPSASVEPVIEQKPEAEIPRERYEEIREVWSALRKDLNERVATERGSLRKKIGELEGLVRALPQTDTIRIAGLAEVQKFREQLRQGEVIRRQKERALYPTEETLKSMRRRINGLRNNEAKMNELSVKLTGVAGNSSAEKLLNLFRSYQMASPSGVRKAAYLNQLNSVRAILGLDAFETAEPETPPAEDEGQVISLADARAAREKKKKKGA